MRTRYIFYFLAGLLLMLSLSGCSAKQQPALSIKTLGDDSSQFPWGTASVDAGVRIIGTVVKYTATLYAPTPQDKLSLPDRVIGSCSCMKPTFTYFSKEKRPYVKINFELQGKGPQGPQEAEVRLLSGRHMLGDVKIAYLSEPAIAVTAQAIDVSTLQSKSGAVTEELRLINNLKVPLQARLIHQPPFLLVRCVSSTSAEKVYAVSTVRSIVPGLVNDDIIWAAPAANGGKIYVAVGGQVQGEYHATPNALTLLESGRKYVTAKFSVVHNNNKSTQMLNVVTDDRAISVKFEKNKENGVFNGTVKWQPHIGEASGIVTGAIMIEDKLHKPLLRVPYEIIRIN